MNDHRQKRSQEIAEKTLRLLENQNWLVTGRIVFYVLPLAKRAILIFDPLALRKPELVVSPTFVHRLSTALGGCRVVPTNSRGIYLQVAYTRLVMQKLSTQTLDLHQQASALNVPIGQTRRGSLWLSVTEMDSVLIGGTRRMGKTNLLHTWISALLHGNEAQLVLWDGKDGTEFGRYAQRENTLVGDDLNAGLQHLTDEITRRKRLFLSKGVNNLPAYNRTSRAKLLPLVLMVDEAALIPTELQKTLSRVIAVGGAYGIHPVIATQRPDAKAVQGMLKANLSTRIALPVPAHHDSQVILGHSGAEKLPKKKGRLLLVWNARLIEAQAYLAPQVDQPQLPDTIHLLTAREMSLVQAAVANDNWFRVREIAQTVGESRDWVNAIAKQWERSGYLTPVQRNEKGHPQGRKVTDTLVQAAGLGGSGDLADLADWDKPSNL